MASSSSPPSSSSSSTSFDAEQYKIAQRQTWDSAALGWQRWWQVIEKGAQKISNRLIELAEIRPGQQVLDIATGIGEPSLTAAKLIGTNGGGGHVLAIDISSQMLAIAKERAVSLGLQDIIEFRESDIEALELPSSSFDAILCRWGLMFLPNLDSTLNHIFLALINGGKFAAAVWSMPSKVPFLSFPMNIVMKQLQLPQPASGVPGPFSLADNNNSILEGSLSKAGFRNIHIERQNVTFEFASVKDYINHIQDVAGAIKIILNKESANRQEEVWKVITEELSASNYTKDNGSVRMDNECICVVGTRV
jgi:ubiquinone/menaquinone biosynthesis C-methylase UbiE